MKCRHCAHWIERRRGHWTDATYDLADPQAHSRARTCDTSPVMAKLHAPELVA